MKKMWQVAAARVRDAAFTRVLLFMDCKRHTLRTPNYLSVKAQLETPKIEELD